MGTTIGRNSKTFEGSFMNFQDYVASQFEVKIIKEGRRKGRVCFKSPLGVCTLTKEGWKIVLDKMNKVEL